MEKDNKGRRPYEGLESYEAGYSDGYSAGFEDCKEAIIQYMKAFIERNSRDNKESTKMEL